METRARSGSAVNDARGAPLDRALQSGVEGKSRPYNVASLQQRRYRGDIWYVSRTCSPASANMSVGFALPRVSLNTVVYVRARACEIAFAIRVSL